jgi:hypothetical protein
MKIHGNKGKIRTLETRKKLSDVKKNNPDYVAMLVARNKSRIGIKLTDKQKEKMGSAWRGKKRPIRTKLWCEKLSKSKIGSTPWNKGVELPQFSGENHHNWLGGDKDYGAGWTDDLKESIRKRDDFTCQLCGLPQIELTGFYKKLHVHHIDYNKKNLNPDNLISLCNRCHMKTNFNRDYWTNFFNNK